MDVGQANIDDHGRVAGVRGCDNLDQAFNRVLKRVRLMKMVVAAISAASGRGSAGSLKCVFEVFF